MTREWFLLKKNFNKNPFTTKLWSCVCESSTVERRRAVWKSPLQKSHTPHSIYIIAHASRNNIPEEEEQAHITIAIHSLITKRKVYTTTTEPSASCNRLFNNLNTVVVYKWSSWKRPQLQPQRPPWRLQPRSRHSHRSPPCRRGQRMSLTIQGESALYHISKNLYIK